VTWPTRKDVLIGSLMVFVLAALAAIFFLLLDQIYKFLLDIILTINI
jgi:preprotein translocase subunit SecE